MKKKIKQNLIQPLKKGLTTPNLPVKILYFNNIIIVKIFRSIGLSSSTALIFNLDKNVYINLTLPYLIIFLIFSFLFFVYNIWLNYHRIIYMYKVLKSGELDIRNSPIRRIPTFLSKVYFCAKGACESVVFIGGGLGFCAGVDGILGYAGRDPLIMPAFGKLVNHVLPVNDNTLISLSNLKRNSYEEHVKLCLEYDRALDEKDEELVNALGNKIRSNLDKRIKIQKEIDYVKSELSKRILK